MNVDRPGELSKLEAELVQYLSDLTVPEAEAMAAKLGVDLLAENPDERRPAQRPPGRAG